jgi:nitrate reductase assembly molybdenum cofactor insertion protein NarJ
MNVLSLETTALSQHSVALQKMNKTASLLRFYFAHQQQRTVGLFNIRILHFLFESLT